MKRFVLIGVCLLFLAGIVWAGDKAATEAKAAKEVTIAWTRCVDKDAKPINCCGISDIELKKAVQMMEEAGVKVTMNMTQVTQDVGHKSCSAMPLATFNGKTMEELLGGEKVTAKCSQTCAGHEGGKAECQMLKVGDKTYENIPADMIAKAGLLACGVEVSKAVSTEHKGCSKSCATTCGTAAAAACDKTKTK